MGIPVAGFMFHSGEEGRHSHHLFITHWNHQPVHVHEMAGVTSFDAGHNHRYAGQTAPAPSGVNHAHSYAIETTFDDGHTHMIRGITGPAIQLPNGGHIHYFQGVTTVNGRIPHTHRYRGQTSGEI